MFFIKFFRVVAAMVVAMEADMAVAMEVDTVAAAVNKLSFLNRYIFIFRNELQLYRCVACYTSFSC